MIDQEGQKYQETERIQLATLLLEADIDCYIVIDGEDQGLLERDLLRLAIVKNC